MGTHGWLGLASALFATPGPQRLVVQDAGKQTLHATGIVVHGPDISPAAPTYDDLAWQEYRENWLAGDRASIPAPGAFLQRLDSTGSAGDLAGDLVPLWRSIAHGLAWLWLASGARVERDQVTATFEGARRLDLDLSAAPAPAGADDTVTLWRWAVATVDSVRHDSVQQAVTLGVRDAADLASAAGPVLRTAKLLHRVAGQGVVAEAMATRRSARAAAITAARASGDAARAASRGVLDRVLAQLTAALGILLVNQRNLLDHGMALTLLWAILAWTVVTAIVAFLVEFPSARRGLDAFCTDLEQYRDTLVSDDIEAIKDLASLKAARLELKRARWIAAVLLVLAGLLVVGVLSAVARPGTNTGSAPTPAATATVTAAALRPSGGVSDTRRAGKGQGVEPIIGQDPPEREGVEDAVLTSARAGTSALPLE